MSMYSKFQKNMLSFQGWSSVRYSKEVAIGVVVLVVLTSGYFLNVRYVRDREEKAFIALSEVIESFTQAQQATQELDNQKDQEKMQQAWADTEILLEALHKEHMSSYLAPYFLVFKSQIILEKDHDLEGAIKVLDEALAQMPKNSEMSSLFQMKRIKMGFDSQKEENQKQALADLIIITQDSKNPSFDEALYLLGVYYLYAGDIEKSQEAFKRLVDSADASAVIQSPWLKQAREKLVSNEAVAE